MVRVDNLVDICCYQTHFRSTKNGHAAQEMKTMGRGGMVHLPMWPPAHVVPSADLLEHCGTNAELLCRETDGQVEMDGQIAHPQLPCSLSLQNNI